MSVGSLTFNGFDIAVLLVVFISLFMAMGRGFFRELISILALVIALILSLFVWGHYRASAQDFIHPDWLADGVLGAGTFMIAYLIVVFFMSGISKKLRGKQIGLIDRFMGGGFGAARGFIIAALFTMILTAQYRDAQDALKLKDYMKDHPDAGLEEVLPKSVRELMNGPDPQLPNLLQGSSLFPILDKISGYIRALPFSDMKSMAEKIKDGDIPVIPAEAEE